MFSCAATAFREYNNTVYVIAVSVGEKISQAIIEIYNHNIN